uniref:Zinc fingers and homeoboxes protein 1 n=1 Tax=Salmo trutta TaxID=8032 RepID=A0A674BVL6_SALTR
ATCTAVKRRNQPTLEQTLSDLLSDGGYTQHETEESDDPASAGISLMTKTSLSALALYPLSCILFLPPSPQSAQAQLLIPVSSIPSYNQSMDTNTVLVNTYKKFPYPSVSEIMGLSAQTKFSEEQIKIWFSAQRLKHGVSWTPEEVLFLLDSCLSYTRVTFFGGHSVFNCEARRKQFNGTVHTVPQTITVIPAHQLSAVPKMSSHQTSPAVSEMKRATTVQPPSLTPQENSALSADHFGMRPKKSKEQLAELKASYLKNHFASDVEIARLMTLTGLTKGEIKKWFSDTRYNQRNSKNSNVIVFHDSQSPRGHSSGTTIVIDSSDETPQSPPPTPSVKEKEPRPKTWNSFPDFTLQKFKEKTPEEIDAWFTEKRKVVEAESPELKAERMESEATSSRKGSQTPPGGRRPNRGDKNIGKKTPEQLHVLKSAFVRTQWPSTEEYDKLAEESGLPRVYVVNWFGDTRYSFKNGNLKWFFHYQSGNVEGLNGNKNRKRRIRNRGWGRSRSRKAKRSTSTEKSPPLPIIKLKSGKDILKEYYLKHKLLNEQDLDELVTKSSMGYEQVREWFAEIHKREDMGADPFGDAEVNVDQQEEEALLGENEMAPEEQDDTVVGEEDEEEEEDDDTDESDSWEPSQGARKTQSE